MNAIENYISALFASFPKTPRILRMQAEMLENMEEKYQDLRRTGKSEEEAVGIVLSSIGSAEDLRGELGISDTSEQHMEEHPVFLAERAAFQKKFAIAITSGVVLCIFSVIAACLCDAFLPSSISDGITGVVFFAPIALAVALFVYFGIRSSWYEEEYKILNGMGEADQFHRAKKSSALSGLVASILFPLAAMFYLYIGFIHNLWHPGWIIFPVCGIIVGAIESIDAYRHRGG